MYRYKTMLLHGLLTGVYGFIYVCIYVLNIEQPRHVKPFGYIFLEINYFIMKLSPFIHFSFNFHLGVTCFRRVLLLLYRGKRLQPRKPLLSYLVCKLKQPCCDFFHCVLIYEKGNEHVIKPFNKSLLLSLFFTSIYFDNI